MIVAPLARAHTDAAAETLIAILNHRLLPSDAPPSPQVSAWMRIERRAVAAPTLDALNGRVNPAPVADGAGGVAWRI
jgi:hypothetical protein